MPTNKNINKKSNDGRKIFQELRPDIDLTDKVVHHIDGNRSNNTSNNLIALSREEHRYVHVKMGGFRQAEDKEKAIKRNYDNLESLLNLYNEGIYI